MSFLERYKPDKKTPPLEEMEAKDVKKIEDQAVLANIAENGPAHLSHAAIEGLDAKQHQDLLLRIAFDNRKLTWGAQSTAIKKLQELDPEVWHRAYAELALDHDLFLNDRTDIINTLAEVDKEKFQDIFAKVVQDTGANRLSSRSVALKHLDKEKYKDLLHERATDPEEKDNYVRLKAANCFDNQEMQGTYIDLALGDPGEGDVGAVKEAIDKLDPNISPEVLLAIALTKVDTEKFKYTGEGGLILLAIKAVERLAQGNNTKKYLEMIVRTSPHYEIMDAARKALEQEGDKHPNTL